jgi:hypothetical protein
MSWRAELDALKRRASAQTKSTTADARKILDEMDPGIPDIRKRPVTEGDLESFFTSARNLGIDPRPPSVTLGHHARVAALAVTRRDVQRWLCVAPVCFAPPARKGQHSQRLEDVGATSSCTWGPPKIR